MSLDPKPLAHNTAAISLGVLLPRLNTSIRRPSANSGNTVSAGVFTRDTVGVSCSAQPSRAHANDTEDGAG